MDHLDILGTLMRERMQFADLYAMILDICQDSPQSGLLRDSFPNNGNSPQDNPETKPSQNNKTKFYLGGSLACRIRTMRKSPNHAAPAQNGHELLKKFNSMDDFALELYGSGMLNPIRALADSLQAHLITTKSPHFIVMKTDIPFQQYSLHVDSRPLATFYELTQQFSAMIQHGSSEKSYGAFRLVPSKALIVDLLRDMSQPRPDTWAINIPRLSRLLTDSSVRGGATDNSAVESDRQLIIDQFIFNNDEVILIGDHGMRLWSKQPLRNRVVQMLALHPDQIAKNIAQAIDGNIYSNNEPIMRDRRIRRTSIRNHGVDIVHIYHSCTYDAIGFNLHESRGKKDTTGTFRVGSCYVLARFILIDYWLLVGKFIAGRVNTQFFETKKREILSDYNVIMNSITKSFDNTNNNDITVGQPPPSQYLGQVVSDQQYAKNVRKDMNFSPYYPK